MPMIANDTGCMCTDSASGCSVVPTMMMAGIASRKQPTTRNTKAMKKPTPIEAQPPTINVREERPGNLEIRKQPPENGRRAHAEQRDRGQLAGFEQRVPELLASISW